MRYAVIFASTLVFAAALTACGGADSRSDNDHSVALCEGPVGSWTDLSSEPEAFRDGSSPRIDWTDEAGCAINLEFVFHRFGDDHCGWERAELISIGVPIGVPYTGENADPPEQDWEPLFFHNTGGVVGSFAAGTVLDSVPAAAIDTGLRAGMRSLWADEAMTVLYLEDDIDVRVFVPVADAEVSCA